MRTRLQLAHRSRPRAQADYKAVAINPGEITAAVGGERECR